MAYAVAGEGHCRGDHYLSWAHTESKQAEMQAGGSGAERHRVRGADSSGDLRFELVEVRPCRRDPTGGDRLGHVLGLEFANIWSREKDPGRHLAESRRVHADAVRLAVTRLTAAEEIPSPDA